MIDITRKDSCGKPIVEISAEKPLHYIAVFPMRVRYGITKVTSPAKSVSRLTLDGLVFVDYEDAVRVKRVLNNNANEFINHIMNVTNSFITTKLRT